MKSTTTLLVAATTLAAFVNADMLQINNPTAGTIWTAGVSNFVGWTGNCASMGDAAKNVTVILNTGPSDAVRYVATLGTLDCSGSSTRTDLTVPLSVSTGTYSIVVRTDPQLSYTNMFTINNPNAPATEAPPSAEGPASGDAGAGAGAGIDVGAGAGSAGSGSPSTTQPEGQNSGVSVQANAMLVGLGAAAMVATQLLM
ncbi:hypothetical protein BG011_007153 [Mortierella polycephala]|uniref:Yeast cell wall synthesis Kre9/Knh1-like N-terminal domain-containing protein n=1 Tax=Mortierella polycephala TaxID=41804 RepID=A0A9P6U8K9_9FUNG|nr:hypothetical protein BG011_007153 [Mortierella polycephala]